MNVLILTFGKDLCQKYNSDFLLKQFSVHADNCFVFDILSHEYEKYNKIKSTIYNDFHDALRQQIINNEKSSVESELLSYIKANNINIIFCLNNTAIPYIDKALTNSNLSIPVYSVVIDVSLSLKLSEFVSKYIVFRHQDEKHLLNLGIDIENIIKCSAFSCSNMIDENASVIKPDLLLDSPISLFITVGKNQKLITDFIDAYLNSSLHSNNLIVLFKNNNKMCLELSERYSKHKNIGVLFYPDSANIHIASCDYILIDTDINDIMCSVFCRKPTIIFEEAVSDKPFLKLISKRRYATCETCAAELVRLLENAVINPNVKNNYIMWQNELFEGITFEDLYIDIINNFT